MKWSFAWIPPSGSATGTRVREGRCRGRPDTVTHDRPAAFGQTSDCVPSTVNGPIPW
ncbi:hypothetical protein GCM10022233_76720 [Streptomyces shaanxiensis]|uniref:Uncharacterized protein n=1 Tax=Streptomyces shaanxiensis TaxID=653357 RepID=A0ABP7WAB5_9ACTN